MSGCNVDGKKDARYNARLPLHELSNTKHALNMTTQSGAVKATNLEGMRKKKALISENDKGSTFQHWKLSKYKTTSKSDDLLRKSQPQSIIGTHTQTEKATSCALSHTNNEAFITQNKAMQKLAAAKEKLHYRNFLSDKESVGLCTHMYTLNTQSSRTKKSGWSQNVLTSGSNEDDSIVKTRADICASKLDRIDNYEYRLQNKRNRATDASTDNDHKVGRNEIGLNGTLTSGMNVHCASIEDKNGDKEDEETRNTHKNADIDALSINEEKTLCDILGQTVETKGHDCESLINKNHDKDNEQLTRIKKKEKEEGECLLTGLEISKEEKRFGPEVQMKRSSAENAFNADEAKNRDLYSVLNTDIGVNQRGVVDDVQVQRDKRDSLPFDLMSANWNVCDPALKYKVYGGSDDDTWAKYPIDQVQRDNETKPNVPELSLLSDFTLNSHSNLGDSNGSNVFRKSADKSLHVFPSNEKRTEQKHWKLSDVQPVPLSECVCSNNGQKQREKKNKQTIKKLLLFFFFFWCFI
ncbi:hypothetical protein RFI_22017 [Reticulomyxa filosa]|uniref:Uncharacterized protein n=1 Tax=Reticulomyxa filosa TaxID=46433 RepID=X6MMY6_RETFI|nr:hypothetical protein RFI_22017 [Reticulomyxa filosa]|eukprot:ETO15353.1 hypothetical protein RFI_22017 [Reticulomyxa filosa]